MGRSRSLILAALSDHKPKSARDIIEATKLSKLAVYSSHFWVLEKRACVAYGEAYLRA